MRAGLGIGRGLAASGMATLRKSSAPGRGREEGLEQTGSSERMGPRNGGGGGGQQAEARSYPE